MGSLKSKGTQELLLAKFIDATDSGNFLIFLAIYHSATKIEFSINLKRARTPMKKSLVTKLFTALALDMINVSSPKKELILAVVALEGTSFSNGF